MNKNSNYKGIILAGGAGTRLHPLTKVISKQLLPVYNRPMIFYPLSTLIKANIKEIMIITTPEDNISFKRLLGDGSQWGVSIEYAIQDKPEGIAQSLIIADSWLDNNSVVLILGDNLFFGPKLSNILEEAIINNDGSTVFAYKVDDPERYGVIEVDKELNILSIEEKPEIPKSNWIITGMYIYDNNSVDYARNLRKSGRGEYEITDLNKLYLEKKKLKPIFLDETFSWLDTGTFDTLLDASTFVKEIESKSDTKVVDLIIT